MDNYREYGIVVAGVFQDLTVATNPGLYNFAVGPWLMTVHVQELGVEEQVVSFSGEYSSVLYVLLTLSTCIRGYSSCSVCLAVTVLAATYLFYILKVVCH